MITNLNSNDLPRNYAKIVAEKCNVSLHVVYHVRRGERENLDVEVSLLELANRQKDLRRKRDQLLRQYAS